MKKHVLHTLGLAAMAALLCVFCGDNTTDGTAGGEVDALLSKFYNNETPGTPNVTTYTVTFNENGGTGTVPAAKSVSANNSITLPEKGDLSKGELVFNGWNTKSDGTGTNHPAGTAYTVTGNITLYATWKEASTGGGDEPGLVLADGEAWVYQDSGYIFTADNRLIKIFKYDDIWWYGDTEYTYETSGATIITINNDIPRMYTISSDNRLLFNGYTYTFAKESGVDPKVRTYLTISTYPGYAGSVSKNPDRNMYPYGEQVIVTASSDNSRYTFQNWTGASMATTASVTITMDGDKTLTANFTWPPPPTIYTFEDDRDGTTYKWVQIGTQKWMAENLNYDVEGSKCYNNSADSCAKYGRLYNWSTAMGGKPSSSTNPSGVQGVCPAGWHIPSDDEWTTLMDYVGGALFAGTKLKSSTGWRSSSNVPVGTNEYGFTALPGGGGYSDGYFIYAGINGLWWSATEYNADNAWYRNMYYLSGTVYRYYADYNTDKASLFSVRCVAD